MSDDNKVRPIRQGIKVFEEEVLRPVPAIQERLEFLKELADNGKLREFTYVGVTSDNEIYSEYVGILPESPHTMYAELEHITKAYYHGVFCPVWLGVEDEEWE